MREALQKLDDEGHIAYVVGGSVRDFFLGREPKDHDIATSATPDELCRIFPNAITVGKAFGVLKVPVRSGTEIMEIATFREDLEYRDHRHPDGILIAGPSEDAHRRDFTVNALFYDHKTSRVLDTVGGIEDLKARCLRAIGKPSERFREDALRLLRAIRFSTALGFELEPETRQAVLERARLLKKVSAERIRDELSQMWSGRNPDRSLGLLAEYGLLEQVLPEVQELRSQEKLWRQTLRTLRYLGEQEDHRSPSLYWAAVLYGTARPKQFEPLQRIASRMRLSAEESRLISWLVEESFKFREVFQMREATLQRFIRQEAFELLLIFHKAVAIATDGNLVYHEFCESRFKEIKSYGSALGLKLVTGQDLIQLGLQPGPKFTEILRSIEDLTLERKLKTKEEALEYVIRHFVG